jgi:hypothetical protein
MRDVRQLSELLLATGDWTVAGLGPYGQQRGAATPHPARFPDVRGFDDDIHR